MPAAIEQLRQHFCLIKTLLFFERKKKYTEGSHRNLEPNEVQNRLTTGASTQQQELPVRTRQKIGPDLITFLNEQSTVHGAIGAYGPVKS